MSFGREIPLSHLKKKNAVYLFLLLIRNRTWFFLMLKSQEITISPTGTMTPINQQYNLLLTEKSLNSVIHTRLWNTLGFKSTLYPLFTGEYEPWLWAVTTLRAARNCKIKTVIFGLKTRLMCSADCCSQVRSIKTDFYNLAKEAKREFL